MILVTVREDDAADPVSLREEIGHLGQDEIDPQHLLLGKHQAGINDQNVLLGFEEGHVHPDLAQPPQGDDADPRFVMAQDVRNPPWKGQVGGRLPRGTLFRPGTPRAGAPPAGPSVRPHRGAIRDA